ncbi:MAG: hypothetical protein ACRDHL_00540, partial [Candidatus Promineifilaceae bacterium]
MKLSWLLFLALLLAACRPKQAGPSQAPPAGSPSPSPERAPTQLPPPARATQVAGTAAPPDTPEPTPAAAASSAPTGPAGLPAPSLFASAWDDRSPFLAGLIPEQVAGLEALAAAPVYHLDFSLSADLLSLTAEQEVRLINQEPMALDALYFHLYPNLLGGAITFDAVSLDGQPAAIGLEEGDSILRLDLPSPLAPGEAAVVGLSYEVSIPADPGRNYGVFSSVDGTLALAHFYPQLAVYDAGEGWNTRPPPENADPTYADAAFYLARVTAPAEQVLVASGLAAGREPPAGGQQTAT